MECVWKCTHFYNEIAPTVPPTLFRVKSGSNATRCIFRLSQAAMPHAVFLPTFYALIRWSLLMDRDPSAVTVINSSRIKKARFISRAFIHLAVRRHTAQCHDVSKPPDWVLEWVQRSKIWQVSRQHCYRGFCQIIFFYLGPYFAASRLRKI